MSGRDKIITSITCHVWIKTSAVPDKRTERKINVINTEKIIAYIDNVLTIVALSCRVRLTSDAHSIPQFVEMG
jgi:hypothetical protein